MARKRWYPWLRVYNNILTNTKLSGISDADGWGWVRLLAIASDQPVRGTLPHQKKIADVLGKQVPATGKMLERLAARGLLDKTPNSSEYEIHDWGFWQQSQADDTEQIVGKKMPESSNKVRTLLEESSHSGDKNIRNDAESYPPRVEQSRKEREIPPLSPKGEVSAPKVRKGWLTGVGLTDDERDFGAQFYRRYPKRLNAEQAFKVWQAWTPCRDEIQTMQQQLADDIEANGWQPGQKRGLPDPETWLRQHIQANISPA